ncbi:MAG: P27 family phage terminase small subunit [Actinobacteria bacterium]|nr:P27 family phage terminase small subunit [Actinomycetota bacterium]
MADKAPPGLGPRARRLWRDLQAAWQFSADEAAILELAVQALDRCDKAQELLVAEGLVVKDRFGQPREHPAASIRTSAEASCARLLRQLGLSREAQQALRNENIRTGLIKTHSTRRRRA